MKLLDRSVLQGPTLRFGSDQLKALSTLGSPEDDALLVAGLTEALSKASVIGNRGATAKRQRCNFDELVQEYGSYFDRTYRMSHDSFMKLHSILFDTLDTANKGPNGGIDSRLKLSVATHYFAGGDPLDIMASHGISHASIFSITWDVVDAINSNVLLSTLSYPSSHLLQQEIADGFRSKSMVGFDNCAGCIDRILIEIEMPTETNCRRAVVDSSKFFCGRKHRHGFNMQAVCDYLRRFVDVSIRNPGSASDFLSYATSTVFTKISSPGLLNGDGTESRLLPLLSFLGEFLLVLPLLLFRLDGDFGFTIVSLFSCRNLRVLVLRLPY